MSPYTAATTAKIRKIAWNFCIAAVAAFLLNGCVLVDKDYRYGYIAFEGEDVYGTGTDVVMPANAPSISQRYQPVPVAETGMEIDKGHRGIDVIGKRRTPVIAPADGVVLNSFWEPMYGQRILISHGVDADGRELLTRYYHLKSRKVRKGDGVVRGQVIGTLGMSGVLAPNPHLHFETLRSAKQGSPDALEHFNPHWFWWDGKGRVTCFDKRRDFTGDSHRLTYPVPCRDVPWQ